MNTHDVLITSSNTIITAHSLTEFCDDYLSANAFKDYAPNGLQVDGGRPIQRIITGVTACEALIDAAIADNADAIMVHHNRISFICNGSINQCFTGSHTSDNTLNRLPAIYL